jgi:hypothetical protein
MAAVCKKHHDGIEFQALELNASLLDAGIACHPPKEGKRAVHYYFFFFSYTFFFGVFYMPLLVTLRQAT